jgi:hypothetical protein
MKKLRQFQHGDVLLQEVASIPAGVVQLPHRNPVIVAYGETTGHRHIIQSASTRVWVLTRNGIDEMFVEIQAPVTITHDEHKPLPIPQGIYRVGRVKEYDYLMEMERRVLD